MRAYGCDRDQHHSEVEGHPPQGATGHRTDGIGHEIPSGCGTTGVEALYRFEPGTHQRHEQICANVRQLSLDTSWGAREPSEPLPTCVGTSYVAPSPAPRQSWRSV